MSNSGGPRGPFFLFTPTTQHMLIDWEVYPIEAELYQNEKVTRIIGSLKLEQNLLVKNDMFLSNKRMLMHKNSELFYVTKKYSFLREEFFYRFSHETKKKQVEETHMDLEDWIANKQMEKL